MNFIFITAEIEEKDNAVQARIIELEGKYTIADHVIILLEPTFCLLKQTHKSTFTYK